MGAGLATVAKLLSSVRYHVVLPLQKVPTKLTRNSLIVENLSIAADDPCCTYEIVSKIFDEIVLLDDDCLKSTDRDDFLLYDMHSSMESLTSSDCNGLKGGLRLLIAVVGGGFSLALMQCICFRYSN